MFRKLIPCLVASLFAACVTAEKDVATPGQPTMTPEQQKMMEEATRLATPGPEHKRLDAMAGSFDATARWQHDPSQPEEVSKGKSTSEWILDGRFLQTSFEGSAMGQPFEGFGLMGFDNSKRQYEAFWTDSMGTMMLPIYRGTADANGKVITLRGEYDCPIRKQHIAFREVMTIADRNRYTIEFYERQPDGTERRSMSMEYTRSR